MPGMSTSMIAPCLLQNVSGAGTGTGTGKWDELLGLDNSPPPPYSSFMPSGHTGDFGPPPNAPPPSLPGDGQPVRREFPPDVSPGATNLKVVGCGCFTLSSYGIVVQYGNFIFSYAIQSEKVDCFILHGLRVLALNFFMHTFPVDYSFILLILFTHTWPQEFIVTKKTTVKPIAQLMTPVYTLT